ncbi:MAG: ribonuclease HIII [Kiritimatiellae bacterium]|nr:ribonuclease HIII [Kiritimatiellia bacterium]
MSYSCKLTPAQREKLVALLSSGNYRPVSVPHTDIAVEGADCRVNLYTSGKLLIQGKGTEDFVVFVLEPNVLMQATLGYEEVLNPEATAPHMGIDESGKGDFFGPLVVSAAYTDPVLSKTMQQIGVKDCKKLSDKQVFAIGAKLRDLLGRNRYSLVAIGPETYNRLYAKIRNVNRLLAWAHARAIENLLNTVPSCPRAVADQFGATHQIERALMQKGRAIVLEQHHKAESDIAVAAASVLAREGFLYALQRMSKEYDLAVPKGASDAVRQTAGELVRRHGPAILLKAAKCHFRTTDLVLAAAGSSRAALGPEGAAISRSAGEEGGAVAAAKNRRPVAQA